MKLAILALATLISVNSYAAFECDALVGKWQCKSDDGSSSVDTYTNRNGVLVVSSVDEDGETSPELLFDGKTHPMVIENLTMNYTATVACAGDKAIMGMEYIGDATTDDGTLLDLVGTNEGSLKISGNSLKVKSVDTLRLSFEGQEVHRESNAVNTECKKL